MSQPHLKLRAQIAAKKRHHPDADLTQELEELRVLTLEAHIRKVVDEAPPLTDEQKNRLARIFVSAGAE